MPIVFVLGFPVIWVSILLLLSHIGGWARLAKCYIDNGDEPGDTHRMRSGYVGLVNYRSCLNLRVCKSGLRLSVLFPFRVGHPPLLIPWDHFHSIAEKRVFFIPFLTAEVGIPVVARVILPIWLRKSLLPRECTE